MEKMRIWFDLTVSEVDFQTESEEENTRRLDCRSVVVWFVVTATVKPLVKKSRSFAHRQSHRRRRRCDGDGDGGY